jgi:hypothetical protein
MSTEAEAPGEDWIVIYKSHVGWDAAVACGLLRDAEIPAVQTNDTPGFNALAGAPSGQWSAVFIPPSYRLPAERILKDMLAADESATA